MADVHSKETRSYNMSHIRSKDTKPEMLVRKFLNENGFRFRLHVKDLPGNPDIVLPKYKTVIFVHGCFWHGHEGCKYFILPKSNEGYWHPKIQKNISKDQNNKVTLSITNWKSVTVWECQLKRDLMCQTLTQLLGALKTNYFILICLTVILTNSYKNFDSSRNS